MSYSDTLPPHVHSMGHFNITNSTTFQTRANSMSHLARGAVVYIDQLLSVAVHIDQLLSVVVYIHQLLSSSRLNTTNQMSHVPNESSSARSTCLHWPTPFSCCLHSSTSWVIWMSRTDSFIYGWGWGWECQLLVFLWLMYAMTHVRAIIIFICAPWVLMCAHYSFACVSWCIDMRAMAYLWVSAMAYLWVWMSRTD